MSVMDLKKNMVVKENTAHAVCLSLWMNVQDQHVQMASSGRQAPSNVISCSIIHSNI